ncbi:putative autophagy-related protein 11 [Ruditapes philippinarum]|uniref:putative autophagy-related protein 11 n=1 Tax=Ruditapes philippinarum TaxID=129788 RepID=UPI00295A948A|nr:putative autophagy-related protein 11 [Ruditapes philippinarum]
MNEDPENPPDGGNKDRKTTWWKYLRHPSMIIDSITSSIIWIQVLVYQKFAGRMPLFLKSKADDLELQVKNLNAVIAENKTEKTNFLKENRNLEERNSELNDKNSQLNDKNETIENEKRGLEEHNLELRNLNDKLNQDLKILKGEYKHLKDMKEAVEIENQKQNELIQDLSKKEQKLNKVYEEEMSKNRQLEDEQKELRIENDGHINRNKELTKKVSDMDQKFKNLQETINKRVSEINQASDHIHFLENDIECKENNMQELRGYISSLTEENRVLEEEKQDALRRLSEQVSVKLRDNNPNIVDLSDPCRATKLAEMFGELYDNEWTNAFSVLEDDLTEEHAIIVLLDTVMLAYNFCEQRVDEPWKTLVYWFLDENLPGAQQTSKWLKDSRKVNVQKKVPEVDKIFSENVSRVCDDKKLKSLLSNEDISTYFTKCIELCLLMVTTDPPVVLVCPGWNVIHIQDLLSEEQGNDDKKQDIKEDRTKSEYEIQGQDEFKTEGNEENDKTRSNNESSGEQYLKNDHKDLIENENSECSGVKSDIECVLPETAIQNDDFVIVNDKGNTVEEQAYDKCEIEENNEHELQYPEENGGYTDNRHASKNCDARQEHRDSDEDNSANSNDPSTYDNVIPENKQQNKDNDSNLAKQDLTEGSAKEKNKTERDENKEHKKGNAEQETSPANIDNCKLFDVKDENGEEQIESMDGNMKGNKENDNHEERKMKTEEQRDQVIEQNEILGHNEQQGYEETGETADRRSSSEKRDLKSEEAKSENSQQMKNNTVGTLEKDLTEDIVEADCEAVEDENKHQHEFQQGDVEQKSLEKVDNSTLFDENSRDEIEKEHIETLNIHSEKNKENDNPGADELKIEEQQGIQHYVEPKPKDVEKPVNENDHNDTDATSNDNNVDATLGSSSSHDTIDASVDSEKNAETVVENLPFDKDLFKEYTRRGKFQDYIVWPAMRLHENGPLLSKGVAQGSKDKSKSHTAWSWIHRK